MAKKQTAIVAWDKKFAAYAKEAQETVKGIGGGGTSVRFRPGAIEVSGATVPNNKLECVIVGSCAFNAWYKDKYDSDNPQPPDCYAFAAVADENMAPHEKAEEPQAERCEGCPQNEWGTADVGRGKACGNNIRLGLLLAKDCEDGAAVSTAELATAKVSPTNLKAWKGYVDAVAEEHGRPTWAVVTQISSQSDPKTQIRLEFSMVSLIEDDEILAALEKRYLKVQEALQTPFPPRTEKPVPKARAGSSSKFAGKGARR